MDSKSFSAIDGIRGFAAVLVTLTHFVGAYAAIFRHIDLQQANFGNTPGFFDKILLWLFLNMHSLDILFVVSGFMVCRMVLRPSYPGLAGFLWARCMRIYPPLLVSLLFAVAMYSFASQPVSFDAWTITYNVLTLNGVFELTGEKYNFPSWSMFYEVMYCLLIPALVALVNGRRRSVVAMLMAWTVIMLVLAVAGFSGWFVFIPFAIGSLVALVDDKLLARLAKKMPAGVLVLVYLAASALPATWAPIPIVNGGDFRLDPRYAIFVVLVCISIALIVIKAAYEPCILQRIFSFRPLSHIGTISYSIYLFHAPIIFMAFRYFPVPPAESWQAAGGIPHFALLLGTFWFATLIIAHIDFYAIEMLYFRSRLSSRSKASKARLQAAPCPQPRY